MQLTRGGTPRPSIKQECNTWTSGKGGKEDSNNSCISMGDPKMMNAEPPKYRGDKVGVALSVGEVLHIKKERPTLRSRQGKTSPGVGDCSTS